MSGIEVSNQRVVKLTNISEYNTNGIYTMLPQTNFEEISIRLIFNTSVIGGGIISVPFVIAQYFVNLEWTNYTCTSLSIILGNSTSFTNGFLNTFGSFDNNTNPTTFNLNFYCDSATNYPQVDGVIYMKFQKLP